jgi:Fe-S-cluster-containing dehydrogenase component
MCQQCEDPACVRVCPTGACYKDEADGVVRVNREVCIGCQTCIRACPYEANFYNKELRVADKCDVCAARREKGKEPACVHNCAGEALYYGDVNDPESEVSRRIAKAGEGNVYALREADGCKPTCRFILKNDKWQDILPRTAQEKGEFNHE